MRTDSPPKSYPTDPSTVLFGKSRGRLLAWLYAHPDERFYVRQLVRLTGVAQGAIQRELRLLADASLVTRRTEGRQVYFQANKESPIFADLQQLLLKTFGAVQAIRHALTAIAPSVDVAFIYGSTAKGTTRPASDIDLMVIGPASFTEVVTALAHVQEQLGRDINPTLYSREEFQKKLRAGHHFLESVLREPKVLIIGTEHELGRMGEVRMANGAPDQRTRDRRPARGRRARSG